MLMIRGNDEVIYCVEDDDSIRELIVYTLQASGFQASGFAQGKALYAALEKEALVIGAGNRAEIWNAERWAEKVAANMNTQRMKNLARKIRL